MNLKLFDRHCRYWMKRFGLTDWTVLVEASDKLIAPVKFEGKWRKQG